MAGDTGWVRGVPGVEVLDVDGPSAVVAPADEQVAERLLVDAVARGGVREFARVVPTLSEIYREVASV